MIKKALFALIVTVLIGVAISPAVSSYAGTITGEQALGGVSKLLNEYIDKTGETFYPEDVELLAEVMYHENHSNGEQVMYYTGAVVLNRVAKHYADGTVRGVLYQKGQYSTVPKFFTEPLPHSVYTLALRMFKEGTPDVPKDVVYQAMFPQGSRTWKEIPATYDPNDIEYFCFE